MTRKKEKTKTDPLVAAELKKIREPWEQIVSNDTNTVLELVIKKYSDMKPERMEWLWKDKIPKEGVTLFVGDPGVKKSFTTLHIAATVSQGRCFPNCDKPTERGTVLIISSEDSHTNTVLPRLMAADADRTKVGHIVSTKKTTITKKGKRKEKTSYIYSLLNVIDELEKKIKEIPDFKLLIIDTLSSYLGDKRINAMEDMRCFLDRLSDSCYMYHYAVIVVNHFNKNEEASSQYRSAGSVGIRGAARAQWGFVIDPQNKERTFMLADKINSSNDRTGLVFHIREIELSIENQPTWIGCCDFEDEVIYEDLNTFFSRTQKKQSPRKQEAVKWLKDYLKDGKLYKSDLIIEAAAQCGVAEKTLRRVMKEVNVKAVAVKDQKTKKVIYWAWQIVNP